MQIIDISNKKEKGELSYDMTIDLINPPKQELAGATSVVPENIVRNIDAFTGVKSDPEDLDIILEGFLKSIHEAGQAQKLTHSAQKELIIRKLSPNCILLINSYLDTSNKMIEDTTLHQLVGIGKFLSIDTQSRKTQKHRKHTRGKFKMHKGRKNTKTHHIAVCFSLQHKVTTNLTNIW